MPKKKKKYKHKSTEVFMSGSLGMNFSQKEQWKKPKHWDIKK